MLGTEIVEWFNQVDATYRTDLHALNEVNFARFDARLGQRFAESDARWERRLAASEAQWQKGLSDLRAEMREAKADLIKWAFVFVAGATLTVVGILLTALRP